MDTAARHHMRVYKDPGRELQDHLSTNSESAQGHRCPEVHTMRTCPKTSGLNWAHFLLQTAANTGNTVSDHISHVKAPIALKSNTAAKFCFKNALI